MKLSFRQIYKTALPVGLALAGALTAGCLQRPVGTDQPKTTNVIVNALTQNSVDKIDLLFMIDNSLSMGDKQELLALALPDLVNRLVDPVCVSENGGAPQAATGGNCPPGMAREFQPINNIHIGVITSSLGGFGAEQDCTDAASGETDNSHLLGSLERVRAVLPSTPEFLSWCLPGSSAAMNNECAVTPETSDGNSLAFSMVFADQVREANEFGCGWEASLEAWYRFLVEPYPWTKIVRQNCPFGGDNSQLCVGPETNAEGTPYVDDVILAQRKRFLRPDSLLAIVMLTDENDCSFKATGQSWRLSQTKYTNAMGQEVSSRAYRGSSACLADPNDPCCVSCGTTPQAGSTCPTETQDDGDVVFAGCIEPTYKTLQDLGQEGSTSPTDDSINLRCFDHKRRFGVDYLYPVERYSNALLDANICPFADTLKADARASDGTLICGANQEHVVNNPLFEDLTFEDRRAVDSTAERALPRNADLIFLAGIVGVPWQDLALDPGADTLVYKTNNVAANTAAGLPSVDWVQLLGSADRLAPYDLMRTPPGDPLMHEQIDARTGTDTSINGGEWNIADRDDLQYACTFQLDDPVSCPEQSDETVPCDCTYYGDDEYNNPLCEGLTQTHAKAYPSIRPLQVLRDYGKNSIVASICPKNTTDPQADDFGYRPAVAAIIDRLKEQLQDKCFERTLEVKDLGNGPQANCIIVEADIDSNVCGEAREEVAPEVQDKIYERLQRLSYCDDEAECRNYHLCSISAITPANMGDYQSCLTSDNPTGHGWCYIDPAQDLGSWDQVEKCADHEKRKIRFAGKGAPAKGTVTFFACAGAPQGAVTVEDADMSTDMPAEDM